jgi:hypothetical protein
MRLPHRWMLAALLLPALVAARDHDRKAADAAAQRLPAASVFIDADWGVREDGAARELTASHAAWAKQGYDVVDVEAYTENGDLQGFFVTYHRRDPF